MKPLKPAALTALRAMSDRDPARLGVSFEKGPWREALLKAGLIEKARRMKTGHSWLYRITPAGYEKLA